MILAEPNQGNPADQGNPKMTTLRQKKEVQLHRTGYGVSCSLLMLHQVLHCKSFKQKVITTSKVDPHLATATPS